MEENGRLGVLMVVTVGPSCDVDRKWPNISGMNMHFNLLFVTSNTVLLVWYAKYQVTNMRNRKDSKLKE